MRAREDPLEFIDFLRVVWRQRLLIIVGLLVCGGLGAVVGLCLPKVYATSFNLLNGKVWEKPIGNVYRVAEIINGEPFLDAVRARASLPKSARRLKADGDIVARAIEGRKTPGGDPAVLVRVVSRGSSPEEALKAANAVADLIIEDHKGRYDQILAEYSRYQTEIEAQVAAIEREIEQLSSDVKQQRTGPDVKAPAVILLQAQLEQKHTQLLAFLRELRNVKLNNTCREFTENTSVLYPPVRPVEPVNLKVAQTTVIGVVAGFVPVLLLAFLVNYIKTAPRDDQPEPRHAASS